MRLQVQELDIWLPALVTEFVGQRNGDDEPPTTWADKEAVRLLFARLCEAGATHGDVALRNVVRRDGTQGADGWRLIDLGRATLHASDAAIQEERASVDRMLRL